MLYDSMHDLIGNTPLVRLHNFDLPATVKFYAKLELANPAGSVKDRTARALLDDARARGLLTPGAHIVEATAGNTGIGVAFAALGQGYRVTFVVPEKFSVEKQQIMRAFGATIVNTPSHLGMRGAIDKAREIVQGDARAIGVGQFENPANPRVHEEETGPEITADIGAVDVFVAGAGSGGTFTGIARHLRSVNPQVRCVLADPVGSTMGGGQCGPYSIEGIGNDFVAPTMDMGLVDDVLKVRDEDAVWAVRELARREGIIAGSSSGAAVWAALQVARTMDEGALVTVLSDRGDRYFSAGLLG